MKPCNIKSVVRIKSNHHCCAKDVFICSILFQIDYSKCADIFLLFKFEKLAR